MKRIENGSKDDANKEGFTKKTSFSPCHLMTPLMPHFVSSPPTEFSLLISFHSQFFLPLFLSLSLSVSRSYHFHLSKNTILRNFDAIIKACLVSLGTLTVPSRETKT